MEVEVEVSSEAPRDALVSHLAVLVGVHVLEVLLDLLLLDGEDVEAQERRDEPRRRLHVGVEVDGADDLAPHLVEVGAHPLLALHVPGVSGGERGAG